MSKGSGRTRATSAVSVKVKYDKSAETEFSRAAVDLYRQLAGEYGNTVEQILFTPKLTEKNAAGRFFDGQIIINSEFKQAGALSGSFTGKDMVLAVMAHEYGHSFPYEKEPDKPDIEFYRKNYGTSQSRLDEIQKEYEKKLKAYNARRTTHEAVDKLYRQYLSEAKNGFPRGKISKYAEISEREFISEVFESHVMSKRTGKQVGSSYYAKKLIPILKQYPKTKHTFFNPLA